MAVSERVSQLLLATLTTILIRWLRPYQLAWIQDTSRFKAGVMSRQIGKSEGIALEAVLLGLEPPKSPEEVVLLVSSGDFQAKELLRKVTRWTDLLDASLKKTLGQKASIYTQPPSSECISLLNGKRIVSHPPTPRTLAGFTGPVIWDEVGRSPHDRLVYEALMPITDYGPYPFRMTGTPWGDSGVFYDICRGGPGGGPRKGWSLHQVDLRQAIAMGVKRDFESIREQFDPQTFAQDYMCEFVSTVNQVFDRDLIKAALEMDLVAPKWDDADVRRALGGDIGRTHDKTAQVWTAEYPEDYYQVERVQLLRGMPFNEQKAIFAAELAGGRISRARIDATGLGMQLAEDLSREFPGIAEGVTFTPKLKEELVNLTLALMQSRRLKLLPDSDLLTDLSAIRREYLRAGGIRYDAARTEKGHADSFWALGLSLSCLASSQPWRLSFLEDPGIMPAVPVEFVGMTPPPPGAGDHGSADFLGALASYQRKGAELPVGGDLGALDSDLMIEGLDDDGLRAL